MSEFNEMLSRASQRLDDEAVALASSEEFHAELLAGRELREIERHASCVRLGQLAAAELINANIPTSQVWYRERSGSISVTGRTLSGRGKQSFPQFEIKPLTRGWHILDVHSMDSDGNHSHTADRYGLDINGNSFRIYVYRPRPEELGGQEFPQSDLVADLGADQKPYYETSHFEYTILREAFQVGVASLIRLRRPYVYEE